MPRYFDYLGKEEALPEAFSALYDLLGDVNPEYYLSQARRVIKQALRNAKSVLCLLIFFKKVCT